MQQFAGQLVLLLAARLAAIVSGCTFTVNVDATVTTACNQNDGATVTVPTGAISPPATDVEYLLSDGTSGSWNPFDDGDLVIGASLDRDTTYTISFSDPGTAASPCDTIIVFVTQSCECPIAVATDPTPDVTAVCVESGDITATVPAAAITSTGETLCSNGLPGVQARDVCCNRSCGSCGFGGCKERPGGANNCCLTEIRQADPSACSALGSAPCEVDEGDAGLSLDLGYTLNDGTTDVTGTWSTGADLLLSGLVADTEYTLTFGVDNIEPNVECTDTIVFSTSSCGCDQDEDCPVDGQICCPTKKVCEIPVDADATACGDPHMTGFRGQKFDFTGVDGQWYALFSVPPSVHINMRVSTPLPEVPSITYITGVSVVATDSAGLSHSIVIQVKNPSSLDSSCPIGVSPCLADGALSVLLDDEEALNSPGTMEVAPGVIVSAVNLPGACRSFGFEKYWERKELEYKQFSAAGRRLTKVSQTMAEWILEDTTATNPSECAEYIANAVSSGSAMAGGDGGVDESGLFSHQSEHASFKIVTPETVIRLTHGKLHQVAERDPTTGMDLPDHVTWQMNLVINNNAAADADGSIAPAAKGILGETSVYTIDEYGEPITEGMKSIRGTTEQYLVAGPLAVEFDMDHHW